MNNKDENTCSLKYDHYFLKKTGIYDCPECGLVFKKNEIVIKENYCFKITKENKVMGH